MSVRGDHAPPLKSPAVGYVVISILAGAAAAFIALEAYFFGMALAAIGGVLLFQQARRYRWFALGGFLLGIGLCAAGLLSPALTNHDPAVTYDPSTVPTFWVAVLIGLCGVVALVAATTARSRHRST